VASRLLLNFGCSVISFMQTACQLSVGKHLRFQYDPGSRTIRSCVVADGGMPGRVMPCMQGLQWHVPWQHMWPHNTIGLV
jgi:hypothetical protein